MRSINSLSRRIDFIFLVAESFRAKGLSAFEAGERWQMVPNSFQLISIRFDFKAISPDKLG